MDQSHETILSETTGSEQDTEIVAEKTNSRIGLTLRIALICAAFLGIDVLMQSDFERSTWARFFCLGFVMARLTLICVWGTLVEGTFWVRIPWTLLLLVISLAASVYGVSLGQQHALQQQAFNVSPGQYHSMDPIVVILHGAFCFSGFVISFIPLKIAAWLFGWRITQAKSLKSSAKRYAITDMMIGMAIVALTISIGMMLIHGDLSTLSETIPLLLGIVRSNILFVLTVFFIASLIVTLPCIWIALATESSKLLSRSVLWVILSGAVGVAEFYLLFGTIGSPSKWVEECLATATCKMTMAAAMIGVLWILRLDGYRISRIQRE